MTLFIALYLFVQPLVLQAQVAGSLTKEKIQAAIDEAYTKFKDVKEGKNADYIKELATVDPKIFGIALITTDGQVFTKGDIDFHGIDPECIQSLYHGTGHRRTWSPGYPG